MRKLCAFALCAALLLAEPAPARAEDRPAVSAQSAIMMHDSGEVLYEKAADEPRLIASTTKLMTALVVLEHCALDEEVEIPAACCGLEGSSVYLSPGQRCTVRELLLGLLLASANDAAAALACHVAGDEAGFALLMNEQARALGMDRSAFVNPHGLDAEGHYATARDLARLMLRCMEEPGFRELCTQQSAQVGDQTVYNHNKLLSRCPGCVGGKTGYTRAAGRCLVSCVEREGELLVCVTLSDPDDWDDHTRLYDWAYAHYARRLLADESLCFQIPVLSGEDKLVTVRPQRSCTRFLPREAEVELTAELPRFCFAPVTGGGEAGRLLVHWDDLILDEIPLLFDTDVEETEMGVLGVIIEEMLS